MRVPIAHRSFKSQAAAGKKQYDTVRAQTLQRKLLVKRVYTYIFLQLLEKRLHEESLWTLPQLTMTMITLSGCEALPVLSRLSKKQHTWKLVSGTYLQIIFNYVCLTCSESVLIQIVKGVGRGLSEFTLRTYQLAS